MTAKTIKKKASTKGSKKAKAGRPKKKTVSGKKPTTKKKGAAKKPTAKKKSGVKPAAKAKKKVTKASKAAPQKKRVTKKATAKPKPKPKPKPKRVTKKKAARKRSPKEQVALRRKRAAFRKALVAKQQSLVHAYLTGKGDSRMHTRDGTEDYIDYAVSSYARDFTLSLTELDRQQLQRVEEAIRRLDRREYGNCLQCEIEIPIPRLEVEPWARYCIKCQELDEQGLLEPREFERDEEEEEVATATDSDDADEEEAEVAVKEDELDDSDSDDDDDDEEENLGI